MNSKTNETNQQSDAANEAAAPKVRSGMSHADAVRVVSQIIDNVVLLSRGTGMSWGEQIAVHEAMKVLSNGSNS